MPYAMIAHAPGGPDVLSKSDLTPPKPGPGEVLIQQTAIGVNYLDIYIRTGLYPWPVERDLILGSEGAGVVEAVGPEVTGFDVGDRVAYTVANGAYATHRLVPAAMLVPLPDTVSDTDAAAAMLKGLTTYYLLHDSYPVSSGDTVLFHAAAGGVGLVAGQWLAAKGVTAIGTAGGPEKGKLAAAHGYAHVIDYRAEAFAEKVMALTEGAGVPVVYDSVGKDTVAGSLACLKPFGKLIAFGQSSGPATDFKLSDLARASLYVQRPTLFHYTADRAWLDRAAAALFSVIAEGTVRMQTTERALDDIAAVHGDLEARRTTGSIVLRP